MGARYDHLNYGERMAIDHGSRVGVSCREMGRRLGRAASTISRELQRPEEPEGLEERAAFVGSCEGS